MKGGSRIAAMARKEVYHILRDPRSLAISILMPLLMLVLFGYAIDTELRNVPIAAIDRDHTPASRELLRELTSSGFIVERARLSSRDEIEPGFREGRFRAAVILPKGFGSRLARSDGADVQVLIDGADGTTAATVDNYIRAAIGLASVRLARERAARAPVRAARLQSEDASSATMTAPLPSGITPSPGGALPIDARIRIRYNPELESAPLIVPGLVAVVLMMICALLTSIAITREKESGTLEQVLTTPVGTGQVIVGKLLPYMIIGVIDAAIVLGAGCLVFGVPMHGSWWALAGYTLLFVLIALALGLLISAVVATQRVAMMMALLVTFLPTLILSGFIFDPSSMPRVLQILSQVVPATHYLTVVRGIMLKGVNWYPLQGAILVAMLGALLLAARHRFRTTLD